MKLSERFFKFPIRVYDSLSVRRAMKQQEVGDDPDTIMTPAYIKGWAKIPYPALGQIFYHDSFKAGRTVKEVKEDGFDMTSIYHPDLGDIECMWPREKFEEELDKFAEVYEKYLETIMEEEEEEEE